MKYKLIEKTPPVKTRKKGWNITCQIISDILVLNVWANKELFARHAVNINTGEYATQKGAIWFDSKVEYAIGMQVEIYGDCYWHGATYKSLEKERFRISKADEFIIREKINKKQSYKNYTPMEMISVIETEYGRKQRQNREIRRMNRVEAMMAKIPDVPEDIWEWTENVCFHGEDYCLMDRDTGKWSCSACGHTYDKKDIKKIEKKYGLDKGNKIRHNDLFECPHCGKDIILKKTNKKVRKLEHFCLIQPIDDEVAVARHFSAVRMCKPGIKAEQIIQEEIRIVLFKHPQTKKECDIYYMQCGWDTYLEKDSLRIGGYFDNKGNRSNRKECVCYLYDEGIQEAFQDTAYEPWSRLFTEWAAAGLKLDYNWMMAACDQQNYIDVMEMLWRGRFFKLLAEESENISHWSFGYTGKLHIDFGNVIEEVFYITDKQKINRIRDKNGGILMVEWMRWSDSHNQKISEKALNWIIQNNIRTDDMAWMKCRFSIEQAMNYIERQRKESYKGMKIKQIISQYEDYMGMCEKLHKNTSDEMVYRPRELKRRHDECVAEIERQKAQIKAEEYSKKFGEAEKVLWKIKEKFEYTGEQYFIMVPGRIVDIVTEGNYLHHCAGATDRYFDRIKQNETYICFLRKKEAPDVPFYTIEVEPGGTIRQHRGMYDEEPDIEKVKPFLKEWQKEIRKRMRKEDHELAAAAKEKREANIEELKAKNNTRVLQGLMEDFMEAAGL